MPYWRLSSFYFFYFATLGALVPYWGLYLKDLGFSEIRIGELIATIMATKIIAPNVWGWIADHTGKRMRIIRIASLLAALCFTGVFISSDYWWLVLVMSAFSFFWNATLPQFEATTLNYLGSDTERYSSIRLWGSIGFIATVAGLGVVFDYIRISWLPVFLLVLFITIWVSSLFVPEQDGHPDQIDHIPLWKLLRRKEVLSLIVAAFFLQASHGSYYSFYSLYLESYGYSRLLIGQLWALGVIAEIIIFMLMYKLLPRFGARKLFLSALLLTSLRWLLIAAFADNLAVLLFAQLLHAASFGVIHAVAIHLIHIYFKGRHQGKGQALYSSLSFGAGGAAGSLLGGWLWVASGPQSMFIVAAGISLLAWVVAWWGMRTQ